MSREELPSCASIEKNASRFRVALLMPSADDGAGDLELRSADSALAAHCSGTKGARSGCATRRDEAAVAEFCAVPRCRWWAR